MRICLVSARFPPQRCGVGDYTFFLACSLAESGQTVHVLTSEGDLNGELYPLPPNVHVHRIVNSWRMTALPKIISYLRSLQAEILVIQYSPHAFHRRGL